MPPFFQPDTTCHVGFESRDASLTDTTCSLPAVLTLSNHLEGAYSTYSYQVFSLKCHFSFPSFNGEDLSDVFGSFTQPYLYGSLVGKELLTLVVEESTSSNKQTHL
jgi:hypothetical protein